MSLRLKRELSEGDRPIARVVGGKPDGNCFLVVSDDHKGVEALEIGMDSRFELIPECREKTAQHVHVVGPSGCGKSSTCQELVNNYPGKSIVVSADEEEDSNLSHVDGRIKADETLGELEIEELRSPNGTMVIFDDIEGVPKPVAKSLNILKRALHERGRKYGICTVNVYHRGADGESTRSSLGEMTHMVLFPQFANNQNTRYLLSKYAGLPENFCDLLSNPLWGRRVLIAINDVPQYVVGEHAAAILNHSTIEALAKHHRKAHAAKIADALK